LGAQICEQSTVGHSWGFGRGPDAGESRLIFSVNRLPSGCKAGDGRVVGGCTEKRFLGACRHHLNAGSISIGFVSQLRNRASNSGNPILRILNSCVTAIHRRRRWARQPNGATHSSRRTDSPEHSKVHEGGRVGSPFWKPATPRRFQGFTEIGEFIISATDPRKEQFSFQSGGGLTAH